MQDRGVAANVQYGDDSFNSLELRGELLLLKMSMAINSHSSSSPHTNNSTEAVSPPRPLFSREKKEEAAVDDTSSNVPPTMSNFRGLKRSSTSTRTISSDNLALHELQLIAQGQQLLPQQQQHLDQHQMPPTASSSSELEPSDFRLSSSLHSSSLLDLLLDNNDVVVPNDENTNARTTKNEFPSKLQEQAMFQEHIRQLGQSQMQQFLMLQKLGQQPSLVLQQQEQQRLPTDGIFSFQHFETNHCEKSLQTTPLQHTLGNNNISVNLSSQNLPPQGMCSNIIAPQCTTKKSGTTNKNSRKHSQAVSSPCSDKDSIQGSKRRARLTSKTSLSRQQVKKKTTKSTFQYVKVVGGGTKRPLEDKPSIDVKVAVPPKSNVESLSSLYDYLDLILESRGYSTSKCSASELGYIKTPTPLQIASFGTAVCSTNRPGDADRLKSILQCGLSANPMNKFGDSPFFIVCKRGVSELVKVFIDCGAEVHIADTLGRTPLHHVAWANPPNFDAAKIILNADPRLLYVMDLHGKTPLDFVAKGHSSDWIMFIDSMTESLWPVNSEKQFHPEPSQGAIPDPPNALSIKVAENVASGRTKPEDAQKTPCGQEPVPLL